jgi:hypothetical protein
MNGKIKDRTGLTINNWTFIKFVNTTIKGDARWLCKCSCGNEVIVQAANIMSGQSKKCLKCSSLSHIYNYQDDVPTPVWKTIKANAIKRKKGFFITKEYIQELFLKQNKKCALSGIDIYFAKNNQDYVNRNQTASLDRIDNSKDYIEGNVQWIHKRINIMKNNLTDLEFINYCKIIVNHNKNTN